MAHHACCAFVCARSSWPLVGFRVMHTSYHPSSWPGTPPLAHRGVIIPGIVRSLKAVHCACACSFWRTRRALLHWQLIIYHLACQGRRVTSFAESSSGDLHLRSTRSDRSPIERADTRWTADRGPLTLTALAAELVSPVGVRASPQQTRPAGRKQRSTAMQVRTPAIMQLQCRAARLHFVDGTHAEEQHR